MTFTFKGMPSVHKFFRPPRHDTISHNCIVCHEPMKTYKYRDNTFCRLAHWRCKI